MYKCSKLILKKKDGLGYKVYASAAAAKKAGAKKCGGLVRASTRYDDYFPYSNGMNGEARYVSNVDGIDLLCGKCGSVDKHYSMDDLERLVDREND